MSSEKCTTLNPGSVAVDTPRDGEIVHVLPGVHAKLVHDNALDGPLVVYLRLTPGTYLPGNTVTDDVHFLTTKGGWRWRAADGTAQSSGQFAFVPAGQMQEIETDSGAEMFMTIVRRHKIEPALLAKVTLFPNRGWVARLLEVLQDQKRNSAARP
ncbi:hypothetical protein [Chachezhania antarctica]|uniref:hypothetical protein n=1 Tax=Chachezhania antarctica TaxID=2340860 RepID=UPI000EB15EC3|nr:hypothetical protein [Chachezhania antarctica]|tara:strand:+ start:890 stop:1354 length:465 start_codon:yes stop_codon:yes gene_type:complete